MSEVASLRAARPAPFRDVTGEAGDETSVVGAAETAGIVSDLTERLGGLDLFQRLAAIRAAIPGPIVFTTSFGIEDQAIAHAICTQELAVTVATLDTGRLFPETQAVWAETERRYGTRVKAFVPDRDSLEGLLAAQGADGFRSSVAARLDCCAMRKVAPLARALAGAAGWITGIRADQSADRAAFPVASVDHGHGLIKINPLFDWNRARTVDFVTTHGVPFNTLHDRGFLSIGCAPCTRAIAPGEPERAGRWWWEQAEKKECGLHFDRAGRPVRISPPQN